jgi:hypothetical protein
MHKPAASRHEHAKQPCCCQELGHAQDTLAPGGVAGAVPPQPAFIHAKEDYHGGLRLHALDDRQRLHQQLVKDGVRSLLL